MVRQGRFPSLAAMVCLIAVVWMCAAGAESGNSCVDGVERIEGVILVVSEDYINDPEVPVAMFGHLTMGGAPVAGTGFAFGINFFSGDYEQEGFDYPLRVRDIGTIDWPLKADGSLYNFHVLAMEFENSYDTTEADGVQIHYYIRSRELVSFQINIEDLWHRLCTLKCEVDDIVDFLDAVASSPVCKYLFWLPELPVDPPGECHVGIF